MKQKLKQLGFTFKEIKDILLSSVILAFVFFYPGLSVFSMSLTNILVGFILYFLIIIFAFIPHELAHKFSAMHYKCIAQYQIWWSGLKWAFILAVVTNGNFVIAAPGAVVVYSGYIDHFGVSRTKLTKKEDAIVSGSGPIVNLIVALTMILFFSNYSIALSIAYVNAFLAMFNLIPVVPFDGYKVFKYNKAIWGAMLLFAFLLMGIF
ncbi:MAG: hypothetical protein K0B02_05125 [DPANN group archaeon]|nr:hypothetical protein [DPANN group archaeon]